MRFSKIVPLVLLDQWNWDQIVQIFYFTRVQLFLLFSGRIIGITLWLQRFLGFMAVKRFQGTIYSELFLLLLIPLWWHLSRKKRNPTYRNEIVIRQEHGVHASTTLAAIGYFFSSSFNINSGVIRILIIHINENYFKTSLWCLGNSRFNWLIMILVLSASFSIVLILVGEVPWCRQFIESPLEDVPLTNHRI